MGKNYIIEGEGGFLRKLRSITEREGGGAKEGPKIDYVILARPLSGFANYSAKK